MNRKQKELKAKLLEKRQQQAKQSNNNNNNVSTAQASQDKQATMPKQEKVGKASKGSNNKLNEKINMFEGFQSQMADLYQVARLKQIWNLPDSDENKLIECFCPSIHKMINSQAQQKKMCLPADLTVEQLQQALPPGVPIPPDLLDQKVQVETVKQ